ncbi:MAG: tyrosine-type recombinase/integrase [Nannocystis sp.]|nr:tyrosine-type recombinase/integrase [Nannocystis sp.]MBK9751995.1 tyrosine-type recombinase/integrase [Nannocystis sp.]
MLGDRDFESVTRRDAQALHASLKHIPGSANYVLCVLGSLYRRITDDWELSDMRNPAHGVRRFKMRALERFLTPEERHQLQEALVRGMQLPPGYKGHIDRMGVWALQLLSLTGLRRDEIRELAWPMVDWRHECLMLHDTKTGPRNVQVPSQVMTLLRHIHDQTGNRKQGLVVCSRTGRKLASLNQTWRTIRAALGIPDVRIHDLRHSFASDALMGGVPPGHRRRDARAPAGLHHQTLRAPRQPRGPRGARANRQQHRQGVEQDPTFIECALPTTARRPVDRYRRPRQRRAPPWRQAGGPAARGRWDPLGAAHQCALDRHARDLRGVVHVLALVQPVAGEWHVAEARGPHRGAGDTGTPTQAAKVTGAGSPCRP